MRCTVPGFAEGAVELSHPLYAEKRTYLAQQGLHVREGRVCYLR